MFFNLDKSAKEQILASYKRDALEYKRKKEEEKNRRILEERKFMELSKLYQQESYDIINKERERKKKALMQEYQEYLHKTKLNEPGFHYRPKNNDVVINNWGNDNNQKNDLYNIWINKNKNNKNLNNSVDFRLLSPLEKAKKIIKRDDCMNKFLTDEQNLKEVNNYFRKLSENKQNYYKDMLYSQFQEAHKKDKDLYGTEDFLILKQRKKKFLSDNPYIQNREYNFGKSALINNPILNPQNNLRYNKYFNNYLPSLSPFKDTNNNLVESKSVNIEYIDENRGLNRNLSAINCLSRNNKNGMKIGNAYAHERFSKGRSLSQVAFNNII